MFWTDFSKSETSRFASPSIVHTHKHTRTHTSLLATHNNKVERSLLPLWQAVSTPYLHLRFGPTEWVILTPQHMETLFYCNRGEDNLSNHTLFMSQRIKLRAEKTLLKQEYQYQYKNIDSGKVMLSLWRESWGCQSTASSILAKLLYY